MLLKPFHRLDPRSNEVGNRIKPTEIQHRLLSTFELLRCEQTASSSHGHSGKQLLGWTVLTDSESEETLLAFSCLGRYVATVTRVPNVVQTSR